MTRLAIISDTHGLANLVRSAVKICKEKNVDRVIHCGDIGTREIVELLSVFPVDYVFGNMDAGLAMTLSDTIEKYGGTNHHRFGSLEIEGRSIAFLHGDDFTLLDEEERSGRWDLICRGHTHRHHLERKLHENPTHDPKIHEETLILNPGAIQRRSEVPGFCIVELPELFIERIPLS